MNASKNPRFKSRGKAEILGRTLEINGEHLAYLLHALADIFPKNFYKRKCAAFIQDYMETVRELECDDDHEVRDYRINKLLENMPYITHDTAELIFSRYKDRPMSRLDSAIYNEPELSKMLVENILIMLIHLHYSAGFGKKRMSAFIDGLTWFDEPLDWLADKLGAELISDNDDVWQFLKAIDKSRKREQRNISSVREQLDAKRDLAALKAYQEAVMNA